MERKVRQKSLYAHYFFVVMASIFIVMAVVGFGPLPPERFVWDGFGTSDRKNYGRTSTDLGAYPEADSLIPVINRSNGQRRM